MSHLALKSRKIIHIDMDCFYAAVEEKHNPSLRGRPVAVGGPPEARSVLCTANYEARKFGVRSAMSTAQALRLCPHLKVLSPNFKLYKEESEKIRKIFERFSDQIEPVSLDEAYLDVSDSSLFEGRASLLAQEIRRLIKEETALNASAGVAPNKFLAKVASDWRKPNACFVVRPQEVDAFVAQLAVEKIYGVGRVSAERLHKMGIFTCADLQKKSLESLVDVFGSRGEDLYQLCRGIDLRPVEAKTERKSMSVENTFSQDLNSFSEAVSFIPALYEDWLKRIQSQNYETRIKSIVVKLKFFDFQTTTHETLSTGFPLIQDFEDLFRRAWSRRNVGIRLMGIGARLKTTGGIQLPEQLSFNFGSLVTNFEGFRP